MCFTRGDIVVLLASYGVQVLPFKIVRHQTVGGNRHGLHICFRRRKPAHKVEVMYLADAFVIVGSQFSGENHALPFIPVCICTAAGNVSGWKRARLELIGVDERPVGRELGIYP